MKTVASEGKGVSELIAAINNFEKFLQEQNLLLKKKISNWQERLVEMLRDALLDRLVNERMNKGDVARLAADIAEHRRDPYSLVEEIVSSFTGSGDHEKIHH